jgi:hypothetical protein
MADLLQQLEATIVLLQADANEWNAMRAVADSICRKRDELLSRLRRDDPLPTAMQLLAIVPGAKDLDAIGFDFQEYAILADALALISIQAAELAEGYLADGGV